MTTEIVWSPWSVTLEEEFEKNPELKQDHIKEVREWLETQKHLPPDIEDLTIVLFLKACEFKLKETKETMELFYTYRTQMPEIFGARDPSSEEIQNISKVWNVAVLPQTDLEGNRIMWCALQDPDVSKYDPCAGSKYFGMTLEVKQLEYGTVPGLVLINDVKNTTLSHFLKTPMTLMTKYSKYAQDANSIPIKGLHYINANYVLEKCLALFKPLIRSHVLSRMHLHSNVEGIFKYIPKSVVPKNYGGDEKALKELNDINIENLMRYQEWFKEEEKMRVDESKRTSKKDKKDKSEKKVEQSLRKLELD